MGENSVGQLGDGTTNTRGSPVLVGTNVASVAMGEFHSYAVRTDGTLWATGYNAYGQLGNGTATNRATFVQVATGVAKVTAGANHGIFLKTDGTIWGMGRNDSGQLGISSTLSMASPVQIATGGVTISAGQDQSLVVTTPAWALRDFNKDNKPDVLWRNNATGNIYAGLMNGTSISSYQYIDSVGAPWMIVGLGDFNNDSQPDILWRNPSNGNIYVALMNGTAVQSYKYVDTVGAPWSVAGVGDFDGDGDTDYVAGNLGLNSHFHAAKDEPLCIYASDYNKDGRIDPVMSYYVQGEKCVGHPRDILIDQINSMRARFRTYSAYANATFEESFLPAELEEAYTVCAQRFESSYLENLGNGKFRISSLPLEAQFAPVYGMVTGDYNKDGNLDVLLVGNSYAPEVISGRDDAFIGLYLRGDGKGNFIPVRAKDSGFLADNDSKGMVNLVLSDGRELIVVGNNSNRARAYVTRQKGAYYKAENDDAYAMVTLSNGKVYKHEFYYGSTYLSQASRTLKLEPGIVSFKVFDFKGNSVIGDR